MTRPGLLPQGGPPTLWPPQGGAAGGDPHRKRCQPRRSRSHQQRAACVSLAALLVGAASERAAFRRELTVHRAPRQSQACLRREQAARAPPYRRPATRADATGVKQSAGRRVLGVVRGVQQASVLCTRLAGGVRSAGLRRAPCWRTGHARPGVAVTHRRHRRKRNSRAARQQQAASLAVRRRRTGLQHRSRQPRLLRQRRAHAARRASAGALRASQARSRLARCWRPPATRWAAPASLAALTASLRRLRGSQVAKKKARVKKQQEASLGNWEGRTVTVGDRNDRRRR